MKKWIKRIILAVVILIILDLLYFFVYLRFHEPSTDLTETNRDPSVYETARDFVDEFGGDFEEWICESNHLDGISEVDIENGFYVVPGLKATKTIKGKDPDMCTSMTPQGLAITDDYMFISAYCYTHQHKSVLYMLNLPTGELLKTIVLPDKSHAGGLAYDNLNEMIWISGKVKKNPGVKGILISNLEKYDESQEEPINYDAKAPLNEIEAVSFLAYDEGYLVAGTFNATDESMIYTYEVFSDNTVDPDPCNEKKIDYLMQGVEIEGDVLVMSQSFGQFDSSLLFFNDTIEEFLQREIYSEETAVASATVAQKLEQIVSYNGRFYLLFESGALAYRDRGSYHVDRVVSVDEEGSLRYWAKHSEEEEKQ